jgi:hypothetical protein
MWSFQAGWSSAMTVIGDLPLFWPVTALVLVFAGGLAAWAGRILRTSKWSAFLLLISFGTIMAATMTPSVAAFFPVDRLGGCILGQFDVPPLSRLLYPNETSLNVALFVPLGVACGLLRRWSQVAGASLLAAGLPFGIEFIQYSVPALGRVCSTADVAANLTGLAVGLVASIVAVRPISSLTSIDAVARGPR